MLNSLEVVINEIEQRANEHPIGDLQKIRKELKHKQFIPNGGRIFPRRLPSKEWSFHFGARTEKELQFNVGFEYGELRHGVAFSLEASRTLPDPMLLVSKIERFNDFVRCYPKKYAHLWMWYWTDKRSPKSRPAPIPPGLIQKGVFIFLGRRQPVESIDYELLLDDLDSLLPLYQFVESSKSIPRDTEVTNGFDFKPGCTRKVAAATASLAERRLDIELRQNEIQEALYNYLVSVYGRENVGTERPTVTGKIDVVVRRGTRYWFYEIKASAPTRACIREAVGQLLEYAFWPGGHRAERLLIVGEHPLDEESRQYLQYLREHFSLPVGYKQFSLARGKIIDSKE